MNKQPPIAIVLAILRAILCHLLVFLASLVSHFFVFDKLFSGMMEDGVISSILVLLYSTAFYLVVFCLFTRLFAVYHTAFRRECPLCRRDHSAKLPQKLCLLFQTPSFLLSLAVTLASVLLIPYTSVGKYPAQIVFGASYSYINIMLITVIALPFLLSLFVLSYLVAARNIRNEGMKEKLKHTEKPNIKLGWKLSSLFIGAISVSILIPILIIAASQFLIFLVFFPAIIAIVLTFCVLRYVRAIRIRRKFLHSLKNTCQKNNYTLSKIQKPYRSLFFITDGISFTLKKPNGKQYDCKLLHSIKRTSPMIFHNDGFATLITPISFFKAVLAHRVKTLPYSLDSDNPKCVIVCPIPRAFYAQNESSQNEVDTTITESKFVFAGIGGQTMRQGGLHEVGLPQNTRSRELDIGDSFNGYKFYNATGFLNAIQHDVLDR